MPLWVADYLRDTTHLGAAEHGAYLLLLLYYWQSGGEIPDDDKQLAHVTRMSSREWKRARPTIQAFFHDGWRHKRVDQELEKAMEKHAARQAAGRRGGLSKAKLGKQKPSIATLLPIANGKQNPSNALASSSDK